MNRNVTFPINQKIHSYKTPNVEEMVNDFFELLDASPAERKSCDALSKPPFVHDIITEISCLAEEQAGYRAKELGWLAWFGQVIRGEYDMLRQIRNKAKLWPSIERKIFELYFIDGLGLREIAAKAGCKSKVLNEHLAAIQFRIRQEVIRHVFCEMHVRR